MHMTKGCTLLYALVGSLQHTFTYSLTPDVVAFSGMLLWFILAQRGLLCIHHTFSEGNRIRLSVAVMPFLFLLCHTWQDRS